MADHRPRPRLIHRIRGTAGRWLRHLPSPVLRFLSRQREVVIEGQALDPMLQFLLSVRPGGGLMAKPPIESRAQLLSESLGLCGTSTPVGQVTDLVIDGADGPLPARHYAPHHGNGAPLTVFFHGGGFVLGDIETHDEACRFLCRHAEHHLLSVGYRLAPEDPFPAGLEDAVAAFRWAAANAARLGADPMRVAVAGDSAGGNLAGVVCQHTARQQPRPVAQLLIYPATDMVTQRPSHQLFDQGYLLTMEDTAAFGRCYLGDSGITFKDPRVSPLLAEELSGLPPALVVTAGFDVLRDEGRAYAAALAAAGNTVALHEVESQAHGFINLTPVSLDAEQATKDIAHRWAMMV